MLTLTLAHIHGEIDAYAIVATHEHVSAIVGQIVWSPGYYLVRLLGEYLWDSNKLAMKFSTYADAFRYVRHKYGDAIMDYVGPLPSI